MDTIFQFQFYLGPIRLHFAAIEVYYVCGLHRLQSTLLIQDL